MMGKEKIFTKLHLYFIIIGGILMVASTSFKYGYVDWLLGNFAIAIFSPTIVAERYTRKIEKGTENSPLRHGLIGSVIGAVEGGVFTGILNYFFMPFRYEQVNVSLIILFTLISIIIGAIVGFLITFLPKKREFEPLF